MWQALKLDELCGQLLPPGRESVSWAEVVAILVIGRLLERNARAAARYAIALADDERSDSGLRLNWQAHPEWDEWAHLSEGTYILRSNVHEWTDEELWKLG